MRVTHCLMVFHIRTDSHKSMQQGLDAIKLVEVAFGTRRFEEQVMLAMRNMGLETFLSGPPGDGTASASHLFASNVAQREGSTSSCRTIHAILRSRRGDGKEAIVVVTPFHLNHTGGSGGPEEGASSLLLGAGAMLVGHLGSVHWLAKDLVWVVPDAGCGAELSLEHWVRRYQMPSPQSEGGFGYFGRAGVMQQAVVVESTSGFSYNTMEVLLEGRNGQLPKLDMYHLLKTTSFALQGTRTQFKGGRAFFLLDALSWDQASREYLSKLVTMVQVMGQQASCKSTAPHSVFKEFLVDAATARLSTTAGQARARSSCSIFSIQTLFPTNTCVSCRNLRPALCRHARCNWPSTSSLLCAVSITWLSASTIHTSSTCRLVQKRL